MYEQLPNGIKEEKDLELYEKYLNNTENFGELDFKGYLNNNKNKYVSVESLICGRIMLRSGLLSEIGTDFIVLKQTKNNACTAIKMSDIKYITLLNGRKNGMC